MASGGKHDWNNLKTYLRIHQSVLKKYNVKMIGADYEVIKKAEVTTSA